MSVKIPIRNRQPPTAERPNRGNTLVDLFAKNFAQIDGDQVTDDELGEVLKALERAKKQATYAYGFVPNSYTCHADASCLNAHRIVAKVVARLETIEGP